MTFNQLCYNLRTPKSRKSRSPRLESCPQKKGICVKVYETKPKKPNSAIRKVAKVFLSTKKFVTAYIPGQGHNLQQHSSVLVRGGRVPDLPGVKYHIIRGKYDFTYVESIGRSSRRSKFSVSLQKKK